MIEPQASAQTSWPLPPRRGRIAGGAAATRKGAAATKRGAAATRAATRAATSRSAAATRKAARAASDYARTHGARITETSREAAAQLITDHGPELRASVWRLRKVRTPAEAVGALEDEIEHLLLVVAPMLVEHPLPVRRASTARAVVGGAAAAVALGEQLDEVAALFSAGTTIAPSVPVLVTAAFISLTVEVAVATSLRVHDLRDAGVTVAPDAVARDVVFAMSGGKGAARGALSRQMVKRMAARVLSRWGTGLVPVVGAVYSAWDAQQTIGAIRRLPTPFHTAGAPLGVRSRVRGRTTLPPVAPA